MKASRPLYTIGNLGQRDAYAVKGLRQFGTTEIHGPFATENHANGFAHDLIQETREDGPFVLVSVVRLVPEVVGTVIERDPETKAYQYVSLA